MLTSTLLMPANVYALDANNNGGWISLGVPVFMHLGTDGTFYLNGSDQGSCGGVRPTYFRVDTSAAHWKEFYALVLLSATNGKPMDCPVSSGCGSSEVWVSYCRVPLR